MAYRLLTMKELIWIENYYDSSKKITDISKKLNRTIQTIYKFSIFLKIEAIFRIIKINIKTINHDVVPKRRPLAMNKSHTSKKVDLGWSSDVIIGCEEKPLGCKARTLYRCFKDSELFDQSTLPMKSKRKPNWHQKKEVNKFLDTPSKIVRKKIHNMRMNLDILKVKLLLKKTIRVRF